MTAAIRPAELIGSSPSPGLHLVPPLQTAYQLDLERRYSYPHCTSELEDFAFEHAIVPTDPQALEVATVAGHIIAKNWLRMEPETHDDSRTVTSLLLSLLVRVEPTSLPRAARQLQTTRSHFGQHNPPGGLDTTYGIIARLDERAMITRIDPGSLGERLTDDQMLRLVDLRNAFRAVKDHSKKT